MATTTHVPTQTVVGTIAFIEDANQWGFAKVRVETGNGNFYASTKVPGLIGAARNAKGDVMAVDYKAVEGKINPNTNQPYINNYIEAIRMPSAEELPSRQFSDDDLPFGQEEDLPLEATMRQEMEALGNPGDPLRNLVGNHGVKSVSQDEFRRSKEEMRWTEALHIAATLVAPQGAGMTALEALAEQIYDAITNGR